MPPLTLENAGALVSGGVSPSMLKEEKKSMANVQAPQPPKTLKGTVARAFYFGGRVLNKGETHELPRVFALEMKAAHKFTIAAEPELTPAPKLEAPKPDVKRKGEKDAG